MKGNKTYRHEQNPEEKLFHDSFIAQHGDRDMAGIVFKPNESGTAPSEYLTPREEKIVISAIQWLGSPLGKNFLRTMGYEKKEEEPKKEMTDKIRRYIVKRCKNTKNWEYDTERIQDRKIDVECQRLGFTLADFCNANGKFINKILKR